MSFFHENTLVTFGENKGRLSLYQQLSLQPTVVDQPPLGTLLVTKTHIGSVSMNVSYYVEALAWQKILFQMVVNISNVIMAIQISNAYIRQLTESSLVQLMALHIWDAKPLFEPMITFGQLDT